MKKLLLNNLEMMKYVAKFCPKQIPIIIFMSILQSIQSIIGVILLKYVIDAISSFKSFYDLLIIIFSLLVLNIVISVIQIWIEQKVVPVNSQIIIGKMQMLIFEKAVALDLDCYENTVYYNKLLTAREQAETRILGVLNSFSTLISSLLGISAFIAIIATVEPIIIIVSVLNVTLSFLFNAIAIKNQNIFYQKKIPIEREMNYIQRVSAQAEFAKEIRIYNKFPNLLKKRFEKRLQEIIDLTNCFANKYVKIISFQNGINQFFNSGVIIYLSYRTLSSLISVGDFIALANSSQQLTSQLTLLIKVFPELYEHAIYLENFFEFMNYQPKIKDGEDVIDDLKNVDIEFKNVSLSLCGYCRHMLHNMQAEELFGEDMVGIKALLVNSVSNTQGFYDALGGSEQNEMPEQVDIDMFGYVKEWQKISEYIREKHQYVCENCGVILNGFNKRFLEVHHINGNKLDNREYNLKCLCIRCHSEIDKRHKENYQVSRSNRIRLQQYLKCLSKGEFQFSNSDTDSDIYPF